MKHATALAPLLALLLAAPPALAAEAQAPRASIPFVSHGGIRDWVAEDNRTVYVQDNFRRWYRAVLFAPSNDLPFAHAIGFDTGPIGTLDKWSTLVIRGQRYPIQSFERVEGPPAKPGKAGKAARSAS